MLLFFTSIQIPFLKCPLIVPTIKRVLPHQLSAASLSGGGGGGGPVTKLQFPPLPREWEGRYVSGQMYKYQASLPKLPVPPLQQTLQKYVASVEVRNSTNEVYIYMYQYIIVLYITYTNVNIIVYSVLLRII